MFPALDVDITAVPPWHPATDIVWDNAHDFAGMGADLFRSFAKATFAALVLFASSNDLQSSWKALADVHIIVKMATRQMVIRRVILVQGCGRAEGSSSFLCILVVAHPSCAKRYQRSGLLSMAIDFLADNVQCTRSLLNSKVQRRWARFVMSEGPPGNTSECCQH